MGGESGNIYEAFVSSKFSAELGNFVWWWWWYGQGDSEDRMGRCGQGATTERVRKVDGGGIEKVKKFR